MIFGAQFRQHREQYYLTHEQLVDVICERYPGLSNSKIRLLSIIEALEEAKYFPGEASDITVFELSCITEFLKLDEDALINNEIRDEKPLEYWLNLHNAGEFGTINERFGRLVAHEKMQYDHVCEILRILPPDCLNIQTTWCNCIRCKDFLNSYQANAEIAKQIYS